MEYIVCVCVCVCVIFMNIMHAHYCAETLNIFPSQPMHLVEPAPKVYIYASARIWHETLCCFGCSDELSSRDPWGLTTRRRTPALALRSSRCQPTAIRLGRLRRQRRRTASQQASRLANSIYICSLRGFLQQYGGMIAVDPEKTCGGKRSQKNLKKKVATSGYYISYICSCISVLLFACLRLHASRLTPP
jgi:hypothetical protein